MSNPEQGWGQGLLDAAESALRAHAPGVAFVRLARSHARAAEEAERWAETMAARYAALVIAAGD